MVMRGPRESPCSPADARNRLRQAEALVLVADLALLDDTNVATPGVAAALAVLAGIAASDEACCAELGKRPRGEHNEAATMLKTVMPYGAEMARDLAALVAAKDESHYGLHLVSRTKAKQMLHKAKRLLDHARTVVNS
jgi:hypothetical protein